jgi:hypothetical protein
MAEEPLALRKLTREQAKLEQRLHSSAQTIPERLAAMMALTNSGALNDDLPSFVIPQRGGGSCG